MRKTIISIALSMVFVFAPATSSAFSFQELQAHIQQLFQIIAKLQQQFEQNQTQSTSHINTPNIDEAIHKTKPNDGIGSKAGNVKGVDARHETDNELTGTIKLSFSGPGYSPSPTIVAEFISPKKYAGIKKFVDQNGVLHALGISSSCFQRLKDEGSVLVKGKLKVKSKGVYQSGGLGAADIEIYRIIDDSKLPASLKKCESTKNTKVFINARDGYSIIVPKDVQMQVVSKDKSEFKEFNGSATEVGYMSRVDIFTYDGTIDQAKRAFARGYKYQTVTFAPDVYMRINDMPARKVIAYYSKSGGSTTSYYIQYKPNKVLIVMAPEEIAKSVKLIHKTKPNDGIGSKAGNIKEAGAKTDDRIQSADQEVGVHDIESRRQVASVLEVLGNFLESMMGVLQK